MAFLGIVAPGVCIFR